MNLAASLAVSLAVSLTLSAQAAELLVGSVDWAPFQMHEAGKPDQPPVGIVPSMLAAISERSGIAIEYRPDPMKRMLLDFREQRITLDPMSNPLWRQEDAAISVYSLPYLQTQDVVLMPAGMAKKARSVNDFRGKILGCELGFAYADGFDEAFARGTVLRQDVASGAQANLQRLNAGRVDGIIINEVVAEYWMHQLKLDPDAFRVAYRFSGYDQLYLRLHASQKDLLPAIDQAITGLKREGRIQQWLNQYTH
ncbi:substrate-binding periplasmic protein [Thalassolituus sp. LLYu03]|uniref:substrate-binding periplasmic protein n=1 Tax=Thalassolituus sp. LLYu03 TaxID=3421656 RepID=UPI003D29474F